MDKANVFKTKTGYCHILPDQIILSRDGIIGNVSKVVVGNNINRIFILYAFFILANLFFAYTDFIKGDMITAGLFFFAAFFLLFTILSNLNHSATPIIDRSRIKEVKFKQGMKWLSRSRFEVYFEDEHGKIKKRLIMLPGSMNNEKQETAKAVQIMKKNNLL